VAKFVLSVPNCEHGRANALDIRAIRFNIGQVLQPTDPTVSKDFRIAIKTSVCARFTTVLGPGADGYHEDHMVVEAELGSATGTIEREAAMTMVARHSPGSGRLTLGADKAYDVHEFVDDLRDLNITPHIAQNTTNRTSAIDARTTRHPGYAISQQKNAS
jgi:hypothetical protein